MIPQQLFTIFATAPSGCKQDFFGLLPWWHYLPDSDFGVTAGGQTFKCDINANFSFLPKSGSGDLPLIGLAIVDDLLRIAGMVAIGFVLYGAIQYIASQGSPEQTARAQSTILNALIGLAIAMVAVVFVSYLGNSLGGS
jgi:hypothetical protein